MASLQQAVPLPASGRAFKARPVAETWAKLRARLAHVVNAVDAGLRESKGDRSDLTLKLKSAYTDMPGHLDVETEAAAYRLLAPQSGYRDEHGGELFAHYWLGKEGGAFALRALGTAGTLSRGSSEKNLWSEPKELWLENASRESLEWGKPDEVWVPIRRWVASVEIAELDAMRELAAELRKPLKIIARSLLDAALGDPVFCEEDARTLVSTLGSQNHVSLVLWPVVFSMTDAEAVMKLIDALGSPWLATSSVDYLPNLVVRLGDAAGPIIEKVLDLATQHSVAIERTRGAAEALALVQTPTVAAAMTRYLDDKDVRPIATDYLQSVPALAVVPLAAQAVGKGVAADLARAVLGSVAAKAPDVARAAADTLPEAERSAILGALERFENLEEAETSLLPPVLASPPWLEKKKAKPAHTVLGLTPLPHTARIVWENEAQRAEAEQRSSHYAQTPALEADILKEIDAAVDANKAAAVGSYKLLKLPKESAIRTLESAPLVVFNWWYGNVPLTFIARYGLDALAAVLRYATIDPTSAIEALAPVDAVEVAPLMADALARLKKRRADAQAWLLRFPETAAIGLVPPAVGDRQAVRAPAVAALRWLASHGDRAVIEGVGARYGDEAKLALKDVLDFDPLHDLPAKIPKLPAFFNAAALPRPRLGGSKKVLTVPAVEALGTMLAFARPGEHYAGMDQVKEACDAASLAEFAWELFQAWLVAGAPSKEQWAFLALAHFGDDECARKVTPLIRAWPGEAAHARAVLGLDVLAGIGTDVALMHLHGIAQKVKFKGLQQKARDKIDQIAEARGLTPGELADRLVPDLGLDDDGSLLLDFGPRQFRVVFDESLKPAVIDGTGKRSADLPKPNKSDDAEKAAAAVAVWKALKKDSKTVASSQILRLELAMCAQRRWSPGDFERFFVRHPLLVHLVRRLVWGAFDDAGHVLGTFRVAEDRSFADTLDARFEVPTGAKVGLVHRLQVDQKVADAWGQLFGDYEVMQPFAQLSREAIQPAQGEPDATELVRLHGVTVPTGKVLGLDARGWRRGPPQDGGVVCWYEKPLGDGWIACLDLEPGIFTGMVGEAPEQKLGKVVVAKNADMWRRDTLRKLGELSSIEFSELVRDLESVRP